MGFRLIAAPLLLLVLLSASHAVERGGAGFEDFSNLTSAELKSRINKIRNRLPTVNNGTERFQMQRRTADLELELATRVDDPYQHARAALTVYNKQLSFRTFPAQEAELLYRSAYAAELAGDFSAGIVALTRLINNYPQAALVPEAYFRRAEMRFVTGSYAAAEDDYSQLVPKKFGTPFYMESLYKRGWSRYRQRDYRGALEDQSNVIDVLLGREAVTPTGKFDYGELNPAQRSVVEDAVRNVTLDLAALGKRYSVEQFVRDQNLPAYEYALTESLISYWNKANRGDLAAHEANSFLVRNPTHPASNKLRLATIAALEADGRVDEVLPVKQAFVTRYGLEGGDWNDRPAMEIPEQRQRIQSFAREITQSLHARAQRTGRGYDEAARWYSHYLELFPDTEYAADVPLLMGDLLLESGNATAAAQAYERAAYAESPNARGGEAALASVLAWRKAAGGNMVSDPQVEAASLKFAQRYPYHPEATAVLGNLAETRYDAGDIGGADRLAQAILAHQPPAPEKIATSALQIRAAAASNEGNYEGAEEALRQRLRAAAAPEKALWREQLATVMYRQGEALVTAGDDARAGQVFLRIVDEMPVRGEAASRIRATAMYDAANAFTRAGQAALGLSLLERFRAAYPQHPKARDANSQLASGYLDSGDHHRALQELQRLVQQPGVDAATRRDAGMEIGRLQVETGQFIAASRTYKDIYYRGNPTPAEQIELQGRLIDLYDRDKDREKANFWRQRVIDAERANSNPETRTLAAKAALALADDARLRYESLEIRPPVQRSLAAKKSGFQTAMAAYEQAADYGIAPVATAAAHHMAQVYMELHDALLRAPAPAAMSQGEQLAYEQAVRASAAPFRADAIEILEANLKRAGHIDGADPWIARSRELLRQLEPTRFAREERLGDAIIRRP